MSNQVYFNRGWLEYKEGFEDLSNDFYVGNEEFHTMTLTRNYILRMYFERFDGTNRYQDYLGIQISDETSKYRLTYTSFTGTAGNGLYSQKFSTTDQDNDVYSTIHCARLYKSDWWHKACHLGVMTAPTCTPEDMGSAYCMVWHPWGGYGTPIKSSLMMMRRAWMVLMLRSLKCYTFNVMSDTRRFIDVRVETLQQDLININFLCDILKFIIS